MSKINYFDMQRSCKFLLFIILLPLLWSCSQKDLLNFKINLSNLGQKQVSLDNGFTISYFENNFTDNPKDTILIIHGFTSSKLHWVNFAQYIDDKYRLVILDLPGHGESSGNQSDDYSIDSIVKIIRLFTKEIDVKNPHIIGHSFGGALAVDYVSRYKAKSLTLVSSFGLNKDEKKLRNFVNNKLLAVNDLVSYDKLINFNTAKQYYIPNEVKKHFFDIHVKKTPLYSKIYNDNLDYNKNHLINLLNKIDIPVLLVWGEKDRVIPVANMDNFVNALKNSKTHLIRDVGHVPMLEAPQELSQIFLEINLKKNHDY